MYEQYLPAFLVRVLRVLDSSSSLEWLEANSKLRPSDPSESESLASARLSLLSSSSATIHVPFRVK